MKAATIRRAARQRYLDAKHAARAAHQAWLADRNDTTRLASEAATRGELGLWMQYLGTIDGDYLATFEGAPDADALSDP